MQQLLTIKDKGHYDEHEESDGSYKTARSHSIKHEVKAQEIQQFITGSLDHDAFGLPVQSNFEINPEERLNGLQQRIK
jgi:hypothetical protein